MGFRTYALIAAGTIVFGFAWKNISDGMREEYSDYVQELGTVEEYFSSPIERLFNVYDELSDQVLEAGLSNAEQESLFCLAEQENSAGKLIYDRGILESPAFEANLELYLEMNAHINNALNYVNEVRENQ